MSTRKTGLHKDVSLIFNGVWDPEMDNIQPSVNEPVTDNDAYVLPGHMAVDNWPQKTRFATMVKVFKAPANIFSSKRRREKKRLSSISKHLIINQSG